MKNLSKSEKALLIIMIACGVLFVYYRYFLSPLLKDIKTAGDSVTILQSQKESLALLKRSNKGLVKEIDGLKVKFAEATKNLPQTERNPEIVYQFKSMGDPNKVTVKTVNVAEVKEYSQDNKTGAPASNGTKVANVVSQNTGKLMLYPVVITVSGDYNGIMNYARDVESSNRIAQIASLNIRKSPGTPVLEGKFLVMYYFVDLNGEVKYDFNNGSYGKGNLF